MEINLLPSTQDYREDLQRQQREIARLQRQLAELAAGKFPEEVRLEPDLIQVSSMVSSQTREPMVLVRWFTNIAHFSIAQARELALNLLDAAEAAQSDAFIMAFAVDQVKVPVEKAGGLLMEFRKFRAEMMEKQEQFEIEEQRGVRREQ
jgi:hypothetical protein